MPSLVRRADQRWPARALLIYVGAIAGPTLVVLYLGIAAVRRQQEAIESLSTTNQRLQEARLVDALEERAGNLASAALQDPALQTLSSVEWNAPEGVHAAQHLFDEVRRQHPLVRQYFILEDGVPRLPRLDDPLPRALGALLDGSPGDRDRFKKTFEAADTLERAGELERARALFAQCSQLAVTEAARAIARARVARADESLGRIEDAARSWRALAADPSNTYNLSGRPQALVAGVELARLTTPTDPDRGGILGALRRDLVNRRWPLTPSQAEYFVRSLDDATGSRTTMAETRLFEDLALAEAVQHGFVLPRPIEANRAYATTLPYGGTNRQIYYSRPSLNASFVIGLSVDLDWTRDVLVPALLQELNLSSTAWTLPILRTEQVGTGFRRAFPFWSVSLEPRSSAGQTIWTRETLAITGTTVAVLTVLLVGVVMVMRDAARESATARLRSELVSGVSHDLKTPLSVIRLYAETLAADPDADACERRSHYDVIVQESVRLSQLIERVLEYGQLEQGLRRYTFERVNAATLVSELIDQYRPYFTHLGFIVVATVDEHVPHLRADHQAVTQAVVNLLDNAMKYSGDATTVEMRVRGREHNIVIEVEDHGAGLDHRDRDRLFEPFYRAGRATGRGGYGLGLHVVEQIMHAHGGRIEIESDPGKGSCFRLVFPPDSPAA